MRASIVAASTALLLSTSLANARDLETRLLLLSTDKSLTHAVTSALMPWGVTVVPSNVAALGSSMPMAATAARAIAEREHVDGVAWISASDRGPALWTYDVRTNQTVSRPLTLEPPYVDADAASVALSLKTLLRSTEVAPKTERVAEQVTAPPTATAPPAVTANDDNTGPPRKTSPRSLWFARTGFGARFNASSAAVAEPRLALLFGRRISRFSAALEASFGPGTTERTDRDFLRLFDTTIAAIVEAAIVETNRLTGGLAANVAMHILDVSGDVGIQLLSVSDVRFDVSLGGGVFGLLRVFQPLSIGWSIDVNIPTLRQQYFVANVLTIDVHPVALDTLLWLCVEL